MNQVTTQTKQIKQLQLWWYEVSDDVEFFEHNCLDSKVEKFKLQTELAHAQNLSRNNAEENLAVRNELDQMMLSVQKSQEESLFDQPT